MLASIWPIVPALGEDGEFGGMKTGRETKVLGETLPQLLRLAGGKKICERRLLLYKQHF
jgi:hypothetical protein